jgi:hypothetical protein
VQLTLFLGFSMADLDSAVLKKEPYLSWMPILNIAHLDEEYVFDLLKAMGYDTKEQFISWDTSWDDFPMMKLLNEYLLENKIPAGVKILLKLYQDF